MFEGYLASRYMDEMYDDSLVYDFYFSQLISQRKVVYDKVRGTDEIVSFLQRNPSDMKLGKDKKYFYDLYAFLCDFAHCNFSTHYYYINKQDCYTCDNIINGYLVRVIVLFIYTKLFESIVTVEGEDFISINEKRECYRLVEEATKFLFAQLDYFSKYVCQTVSAELNKHMKEMFNEMKKSLKEEVGSVSKDFLV